MATEKTGIWKRIEELREEDPGRRARIARAVRDRRRPADVAGYRVLMPTGAGVELLSKLYRSRELAERRAEKERRGAYPRAYVREEGW